MYEIFEVRHFGERHYNHYEYFSIWKYYNINHELVKWSFNLIFFFFVSLFVSFFFLPVYWENFAYMHNRMVSVYGALVVRYPHSKQIWSCRGGHSQFSRALGVSLTYGSKRGVPMMAEFLERVDVGVNLFKSAWGCPNFCCWTVLSEETP